MSVPSRRANGFLLATDMIGGALFVVSQREEIAVCLVLNFEEHGFKEKAISDG